MAWTPAPKTQQFFTVGEAALYLQCSKQTIMRRVHGGTIRAHREGGRVIIMRLDMEAYIRRLPAAKGAR